MLPRRSAKKHLHPPLLLRVLVLQAAASWCLLLLGRPSWSSDEEIPPRRRASAASVVAFSPPRQGRRRLPTAGTSSPERRASRLFLQRPLPIPPPPPPPHLPTTTTTTTTTPDSSLDDPLFSNPAFGAVQDVAKQVSEALDRVDFSELPSKLRNVVSSLSMNPDDSGGSYLRDLQDQLEQLDSQVVSKLSSLVEEVTRRDDLHPSVLALVRQLSSGLAPVLSGDGALPQLVRTNPVLSLVLSSLVSYAVISALLRAGNGSGSARAPSGPYPDGRYDPDAARRYFDARLPEAIARALEIVVRSASFGIRVARDYYDNKLEENELQRGQELAQLLTRLGPTFIKVGQSLSIRTDLLSVGYQRGLATLQDQVPPFSTQQAIDLMERDWGLRVTDVLREPLSDVPVAAASLGQVYKCVLRETGQTVAIKVQRPNIMNQIALDMHLLREVAPLLKRVFKLNTDTVGTVDAWGRGFVDELDYLQEADNAEVFTESIATTPLKDVVFAPRVVNEWTTENVLVTEWVDGERLDRSSNKDVAVLCSIAMNTYLTMLLELGQLHCDPHPGNLLRTGDGRLCILDWGMVTRLDPELQLTLIEHVAHLTSGDYAEIPRDLLLLGFIPEGKADQIEDSGVVELLADIYSSWTKGGGAAAINVNDVISRLQDLTAEKGNLFQIPPYFAYIAKSFSVLEGIGLSSDPKYSIINECLPYVSKRLLTDKETMGPALSTFVFGPAKSDIAHRIVDYKRVEQLVEGFGNYTTSASGALLGQGSLSRTQLLEGAADQLLDLVFSEEETPLQQIVLEQLAKIVASTSRSIFTEIRERSGVLPSGRTVLGTALDPLGLWRTSPLVRVNDLDRRTVETTRKLIALLQRQVAESGGSVIDLTTLSRQEILELSSILVRKVWDRRRGVVQTGGRFARQLLQLTADKLERGERDTRRLPDREPPSDNVHSPALQPSSPSILEGVEHARRAIEEMRPSSVDANPRAATRSFESSRLQQARRRLDAMERDGAPGATNTADDPLI